MNLREDIDYYIASQLLMEILKVSSTYKRPHLISKEWSRRKNDDEILI